ncbi:SPFH domain band 7 family protein [Salmonella phage STP55]|nr:SPFH domain band 7 family protein [Salmonella phage STP55]
MIGLIRYLFIFVITTFIKRLDTARKNVEIRDQEARANQKLTTSLTPEYLQHEYNMVLQSCANSGKCTLIVDGSGSSKMLNVGK